MSGQRVPVIDIKPLDSRGPRHDETITAIGTACREYGVFHITGHGISSDLIEHVWQETKRFFSLPADAKHAVSRSKENARGWYNRELTKNARDMKEVFDFGPTPHPELRDDDPANGTQDGFNRWPDARLSPGFRPICRSTSVRASGSPSRCLKRSQRVLGYPQKRSRVISLAGTRASSG